MRVIVDGDVIELGETEARPTISITDYSRRVTDDFGVTTVVERGFARRMSVRLKVPFDDVDALQRTLADLRAQAVEWVADEEFDSLSFTGFYKDFSLDLAVPPVSFCTLTVEGLAETTAGADGGADPAPTGQASTLQLLHPADVTDSVLTSINVAENDQPVWSAGTTYPYGARVIRAHRQWESLTVANVGNEPAAGSAHWMDIGPTNRWAMFDEALGTLTQATGNIVLTLDPVSPVNALALLDATAATVRVQATGYDRTTAPVASPGTVMFLDLPETDGPITVTVSGSGTVSVGTLLMGRLVGLGVTGESPTAAITDYSRKETDDFGEVTVAERAWAKRMEVNALLRTGAVDDVFNRLATVRARPSLWIGAADVEALSIYGFFKDFSIEVGESVSTLSLSVEGLSKAAQLAPIDPTPVLVTVFRNAATAPAVPPFDVGEVPPGWTIAPMDLPEGQYRWSTQANFLVGRQQSPWTDTVKVEGTSWQDVVDDDPAHPKPEDGATVGATPEQVSHLSQLAADLAAAETLVNSIQTQVNDDLASMQAQVTAVQGAMSALETSVQADITALETEIAGINPMATPNLLTGGDFEDGLNGWTQTGAWTFVAAGARFGNHAIGPAANGSYALEKLLPVGIVGTTYTLSADIRALATSGSVRLILEWRNSSGTLLSTSDGPLVPVGTEFDVTGAARKTYKVTGTVPTNATQVTVKASFASMTGISASGIAVRRVKFELGDKATSFTSDASAYTAYQTGVSNTGSIASLNSTVSTLNGTVSSQATSISTLTSGLSTLTNTVNASSSPNLVPGGFENNMLGWTALGPSSGAWAQGSWDNGRSASNTAPWSGQNWATLQSANIGTGAGVTFTATADCEIGVSAGSGVIAYLEFAWYNSSGTLLSQSSGPSRPAPCNFDSTGASRNTLKLTATSPANTAYVRCSLVIYAPSGATVSSMHWRQVKMEKGSIATPFSGEATASLMYQAYSTLNTSFATLSSTVSSQGSSISTLQTAMTTANGNIATLTSTLTAASATNLCTNSSFESGTTYWGGTGGWTASTGNVNGWGAYAGNGTNVADGGSHFLFQDISIEPNATYTLSADMGQFISGGTGYHRLYIEWFNGNPNAGGASTGASTLGPTRANGPNFDPTGASRAALKVTGTAPPGTTYARIVLQWLKESGTVGSCHARQVKFERGSIMTPYSSEATIYQVYTVANTATSSLASLTTTVNTQGSSISILQSAMSTAQGDVATLKQKVTTGSGNLLPNSSFSQSGWPAGWDWYSPFPGSYLDGPIRDLAGNDWRPGGNFGAGWGEHNFGLKQTNANSGDWGQLHSQRVPVQGSRWYSFELIQACHRAIAGIKIEWYDANNNYISVSDAGYIAVGTGGTNINNWTNRYIKGQAPSNAAFAVCVAYKQGTNSGGDSYMWICRPMLREVDANYVGPSAYTPSGDRASIETIQTSVNGVLAKYGVTLDVNNYITGFQQLNNGATGSFIINADFFAIVKPGGGAKTEYSSANWRAYDSSGVLRARWGVW